MAERVGKYQAWLKQLGIDVEQKSMAEQLAKAEIAGEEEKLKSPLDKEKLKSPPLSFPN